MDENFNALKAFSQIKDIFQDEKLFGRMTVVKHIYLKHLVHLVGDIH